LKTIATFVQETLHVDMEKDPTLLQKLGTLLRSHYSDDVFAKTVERRFNDITMHEPDANVIVTDMRESIEMETLKSLGFNTVKITRESRPIDRDPNHSSEIALDNAKFDYHVANDGTMEELRNKVNSIVAMIS
jgi:hypothetical protein